MQSPCKLTPREAIFIRAYALDRNATLAYKLAGYSPKNDNVAAVNGSRPLRQAKIQEALTDLYDERIARLDVTADDIARELAKMAFARMSHYITVDPSGNPRIDLSRATPDQLSVLTTAFVETVVEGRGAQRTVVRRIRISLPDKLGALLHLGKHLGMWRKSKTEDVVDGFASVLRQIAQNGSSPPTRASSSLSRDGDDVV